jgi:hypothetical protein
MNKIISEPKLKDVLDMHKRDVMASTNCHAIGTIQSFNPVLQKCTATVNYKRVVSRRKINGKYEPTFVEYPVLVDCPVMTLQGGNAALTMPIKKGDTCLVEFNDRDMDNWITSNQVREVNSNRLHSFSDAIILVGLRSFITPIAAYDADRAVLRNGVAKMAVSETGVNISNTTYDLRSILQELLQELVDITVQAALIPLPSSNGTVFPAIGVRLAATRVKIEGLIE